MARSTVPKSTPSRGDASRRDCRGGASACRSGSRSGSGSRCGSGSCSVSGSASSAGRVSSSSSSSAAASLRRVVSARTAPTAAPTAAARAASRAARTGSTAPSPSFALSLSGSVSRVCIAARLASRAARRASASSSLPITLLLACPRQLEPLEQLVLDLLELVHGQVTALEIELSLGEEPADDDLVVELAGRLLGELLRDPDRPPNRCEREQENPGEEAHSLPPRRKRDEAVRWQRPRVAERHPVALATGDLAYASVELRDPPAL